MKCALCSKEVASGHVLDDLDSPAIVCIPCLVATAHGSLEEVLIQEISSARGPVTELVSRMISEIGHFIESKARPFTASLRDKPATLERFQAFMASIGLAPEDATTGPRDAYVVSRGELAAVVQDLLESLARAGAPAEAINAEAERAIRRLGFLKETIFDHGLTLPTGTQKNPTISDRV